MFLSSRQRESLEQDAFSDNLLGHPQYTRPAEFPGMKVPDVLLSGHHESISDWRQQRRKDKTSHLRPELFLLTKYFNSIQ